MADSTKTFNTRIKQKIDTFSNWESTSIQGKGGNTVLLKGEIAVSYLQASGDDRGLDKYFIKIGDGETPYKDLPYITTLDSFDVPYWAKQDELPLKQYSLNSSGIEISPTGDLIKRITFGTWTIDSTVYQGLKIEKTNVLTANVATIQTSMTIGTEEGKKITFSKSGQLISSGTDISSSNIKIKDSTYSGTYSRGNYNISSSSTSIVSSVYSGVESISVKHIGTDSTINPTTESIIGTNGATFNNVVVNNSLTSEGNTFINGTKVLKTVDVATATDATYLINDTLLGQQITNKKYVDGALSDKLDRLSSTTGNFFALVNEDGTLSRSGILDDDGLYVFNHPIVYGDVEIYDDGIQVNASPTYNTSLVNKSYVDNEIERVVTAAIEFEGATSILPTDTATQTIINGYMYKASATFVLDASLNACSTEGTVTVNIGDTIIADRPTAQSDLLWWYIPGGGSQDTWRPISVDSQDIRNDSLNFVNGNLISVNGTENGTSYQISFNHGVSSTASKTISVAHTDYDGYLTSVDSLLVDDYNHVISSTGDGVPVRIWDISVWGAQSSSTSNSVRIDIADGGDTALKTIYINTTDSPVLINRTTQDDVINFAIDQSWFDQTVVPTDANPSNVNKIATVKLVDTKSSLLPTRSTEYVSLVATDGSYVRSGISVTTSSMFTTYITERTTGLIVGDTSYGYLKINPSVENMSELKGLKTPTSNYDAANKKYVDDSINGLDSTITASGSSTSSQVSVFTQITQVDGVLSSTGTTSVLLPTVSLTGKIEDLLQSQTIILNCGSATENI